MRTRASHSRIGDARAHGLTRRQINARMTSAWVSQGLSAKAAALMGKPTLPAVASPPRDKGPPIPSP